MFARRGGRVGVCVVERFDFVGDSEVRIGDGAVRDPRVAQVMSMLWWPSIAAIASRLIPRLIAWVAKV